MKIQDVSDDQTRTFRSFAFVLLVVLITHVTISRIIQSIPSNATSVKYRKIYSLVFSSIFLGVLYGTSLIKILILLSINYFIAKRFGKTKLNPILTWVLNIALLFLNDYYKGYKFGSICSLLSFLVRITIIFYCILKISFIVIYHKLILIYFVLFYF